ncbi:MAG: hypothetical protein NT148_00795, partial [Candidatus Nealsonbacteria bacterium]|nr:hypothetical protein [Candidatus Nealsonbacteria bacterium]
LDTKKIKEEMNKKRRTEKTIFSFLDRILKKPFHCGFVGHFSIFLKRSIYWLNKQICHCQSYE